MGRRPSSVSYACSTSIFYRERDSFLPVKKLPAWVPGTKFKETAAVWSKMHMDVVEGPFKWALDNRVRHSHPVRPKASIFFRCLGLPKSGATELRFDSPLQSARRALRHRRRSSFMGFSISIWWQVQLFICRSSKADKTFQEERTR